MSLPNENNANHMLSEEEMFSIATKFLISLKNGNWDLMRSVLSENVIWLFPGMSAISGAAFGVNEVIKRAQQIKNFEVVFQLNHILYGFNSVELLLHNIGVRGNLVLDEHSAIHCELKDCKIEMLVTHLSDIESNNVFFINGV
ncbi:nuclear transport factor 2 family protein [Mucilaginibacter sp. SP1R1]|uniref:nuclear transport factor 2 family protein n=1 Tax=Mucilaginibacter sp. SP1R1 TaxID=2723091 RepID=UPI00160DA1B9|nr:nuclear transport factor 2 family protein [Mucilaginibacter sp. SP1R1]MBB6148279.1 hypothetical protein [Mucilaginibacter sp. SP1R1]